jgi:hypothetical protein
MKKPKGYTEGNAPIYLCITVDNERVEMTVQRGCDPGNWNSETGRMKGSKEDVKKFWRRPSKWASRKDLMQRIITWMNCCQHDYDAYA